MQILGLRVAFHDYTTYITPLHHLYPVFASVVTVKTCFMARRAVQANKMLHILTFRLVGTHSTNSPPYPTNEITPDGTGKVR